MAKFAQKRNLTYIHTAKHWNVSNESIIDMVRIGHDEETKIVTMKMQVQIYQQKTNSNSSGKSGGKTYDFQFTFSFKQEQPSMFEISKLIDSERLNNLKQVLITNILL